MKHNKYYKKYIDKLINLNPANIKIKRKIKIKDGYGGYVTEEIEIDEVVTFYETKSKIQFINDFGITYSNNQAIKILAKSESDIKREDIFVYKDTTYKVIYVKDYFDICKQIEIEVIK